MRPLLLTTTVLTLLLLPSWAGAQWSIGPSVVISIPTADFSNVSGVGGGFGVKAVRELKMGFGLRGDFAYLSHGKEFQSISTISGVFPAEVRHQSFRLAAGGQYMLHVAEGFNLYASALGGFYWFRTNINLNTAVGFFQLEGRSEAALGWNFGGGFQYDFGLGPLLDIGLEYQTIYNISSEFEIRDPSGEVIGTEKRDITANEFLIKVGVTFFLGKQ